jgi:hypothetical protein
MGGSGIPGSIITVRAESTVIPKRSNTPIEIPYKQTAGIVIFGRDTLTHKWTVTFREGEDAAIYTMVRAWQNQMVDSITGAAGGPYQTDVFCALQDVEGNDTLVIKLKSAWISDVGEPTLNYSEGTSLLKYPVTFSFDYFETSVDE